MKTALEQARDALEIAREAMMERRAYCEQWEYKYGREWDEEDVAIKEALAALDAEKPAKDAEEVLSKMFRDIREIGYITEPLRLTSESHDACVSLLSHFAESYHAERCVACVNEGQKSPCDFCDSDECPDCPVYNS